MKKLLKEFQAFIMTGNVIDFSVAFLMAAAVGAVVKGFVNDIMMPFVGYFTGGLDFSQYKIVLSKAVLSDAGKVVKPENAILYGTWINTIVNLIIIGLVLFLVVKFYARVQSLKKKKEEAPAAPAGPTQEELLAEIRDELKKQNAK